MTEGSRWRVTALAAALAMVASASVPAASAVHGDDEDPVIAVLDSGIEPTHETFASDQVVAWRDFVQNRSEPYDDQGHGTKVASMAAGLDTSTQTPSHAPGTDLAVAKVLSEDNGASWSDVTAAVNWSVEEAGADVVTISIFSYLPQTPPSALMEEIEKAREHGVLVTVLAGNGMNNWGLPTASWLHGSPASDDALIVGGATDAGYPTPVSSMDPEVTAPYYVTAADRSCADCYESTQGTSFATPLVAGLAADVLDRARDRGMDPGPGQTELALKFAANDTPAPPVLEGHGFLDASAAERALDELPEPEPDGWGDRINRAYVQGVQDASRGTASSTTG